MKKALPAWFAIQVTLAIAAGCGGAGGGSAPPPPPPPAEIITITSAPTIQCARTLAFTQTLKESGAPGAVTWSVVSGQLPDGLKLDSNTGVISGTPTAAAIVSTATIQAADAKAHGSLVFNFQVFERLVINPVTPVAAHMNAPYSLMITAQGSGGIAGWNITVGQLPPGLTLASGGQAIISGTPTQAGTYPFTIQATDNTLPQTATLATSIVVDSHVAIVKSTLKDGEQTQPYADSFTAVNGTAPLKWSVSGLPGGLAINASTGQITGAATEFGQFFYTVTVADSSQTPVVDSAQGILNIAAMLQIISTLDPAYIAQSYNTYLLSTGGFYPVTWTLFSGTLPPGLTLNGGGSIYGTPTQLGSSSFVLQASDSAVPPVSVTRAYTLNVTPTPVILYGGVPLSPAPVNVLYHSQIPISGGTPPYTFAISSGSLPPGLTLDPATGYLDGIPTKVGTYNFTPSGTDSSQPRQIGTSNDFIEIRKALGRNDAIATATPLGNSSPNMTVQASISPYIDPINANAPNPDTDYYRLVANAGSIVHVETFSNRSGGPAADPLDSVLEFVDQNGARLQTCGKPAYTSNCLNDNVDATTLDSALDLRVAGTAGTQKTFYAHVFDWRGDARPDMVYELYISGVNEPLQITTTLGPATRGVSYQQQMASTGGTGSVSWSVSSGALPTGWTLTAAGMLSGVATTDGTYTFTIKAQDLGNPPQTAQMQYAVSIAEPLVITSSATFPNACVNKPYTFQVTTSGGTPPIRFSFLSNAWVAINPDQNTGIFSGTANVTGTFTGSLGAIDSSQPLSTAGQTVTLTVVNCP